MHTLYKVSMFSYLICLIGVQQGIANIWTIWCQLLYIFSDSLDNWVYNKCFWQQQDDDGDT